MGLSLAHFQADAIRTFSTIHVGKFTVDFAGGIHARRSEPWTEQEFKEIYAAYLIKVGRTAHAARDRDA
jgi:hypothetical protein